MWTCMSGSEAFQRWRCCRGGASSSVSFHRHTRTPARYIGVELTRQTDLHRDMSRFAFIISPANGSDDATTGGCRDVERCSENNEGPSRRLLRQVSQAFL